MSFKNSKIVNNHIFGNKSISYLPELIKKKIKNNDDYCIYFIDIFFKEKDLLSKIDINKNDLIFYYDSIKEPDIYIIDNYVKEIKNKFENDPSVIIGIGGGATLDVSKAVSNMITNEGDSEKYQGWDLLTKKGVYKIGIPTISGTGAESSRTCVLTNYKKKLKLGMNSEFTLFDQLILDPDLIKTVPRDQYFYTGMDTYIHCVESLNGMYRHPMADALSREALNLCDIIFNSEDMMSLENREKLMVASFLGGTSIGNSYVGLVHPLSAALSIVFQWKHCFSNCLVMNEMQEYYKTETLDFKKFIKKQNINLELPEFDVYDNIFKDLYEASIIHEVPLKNALGNNFKNILDKNLSKKIYKSILKI